MSSSSEGANSLEAAKNATTARPRAASFKARGCETDAKSPAKAPELVTAKKPKALAAKKLKVLAAKKPEALAAKKPFRSPAPENVIDLVDFEGEERARLRVLSQKRCQA